MRFVILFHEMPPESGRASHWDFMLETDEALATWELRHVPDVVVRQPCRRLAEHRKRYLDYQGPIASAGGTVSQWDAGRFQTLAENEHLWRVKLSGGRMRGVATLARQIDQRWTFSFSSASG